ncbi:hypothetical protein, partial [Klebsiella pneumoniae]|uniref:hypothetical protein n=1 Tax=Klebsiella pneumoniae TaxID=573 RepID=UPI0015CD1B17
GFLVLTIGTKGSGADLILSDLNLRNGKFIATVNRMSGETNINGTPYGGFLVLTIGTKGSGADLILSDLNLRNGKFIATV